MKNKPSTLASVFKNLKKQRKNALIAYLAAGYPRLPEEEKLIESMVSSGVDILELGIPFSDPIADGPTIQFASQQALNNGISLDRILIWVKKLKTKIETPIVLMGYWNPIYQYGIEKFAQHASQAGVEGLIVPDIIPEESIQIRNILNKFGIKMIYLVAPTTPKNRLRWIAQKTQGFLYAVSVAGVTGARKKLPKETKSWIRQLQRLSKNPVCVGFGISGPSQIKELKSQADGFIVGSAIIDMIRKNNSRNRVPMIKKFIGQLSKECSYAR
jgi:tryptophan synthase alpha chain